MRDKLKDAEKPGYNEQSSKRPEGEPLKNADHGKGEISGNLRRQRQSNNHDGQEDKAVSMVSLPLLVSFSGED